MRSPKWHPDELRVCAIAYRRAGAAVSAEILQLLGWPRSLSAIHNKMGKLLIFASPRRPALTSTANPPTIHHTLDRSTKP